MASVSYPKVGPYPNPDTQKSAQHWQPEAAFSLFTQSLGQQLKPHLILQYLSLIQHHQGGISQAAIDWLCLNTGIATAQIRALIEFYSFLSPAPPPSFSILFANNIIEEHFGLQAVYKRILEKLANTRARVGFTSCIGLSDQPLSALVNGYAISAITLSDVDELCQLVANETPLTHWPERWFRVSTQLRHKGPLTHYPYQPGLALKRASAMPAEDIIQTIDKSGLRGLGGAGFPTGKKWAMCAKSDAANKYIICNADEGEPGTFKDRFFLTHQMDRVIEGMIIAAKAVGANKGYLYLRAEYINLFDLIQAKIHEFEQQGWLSEEFNIELQLGAGAYVCGEESALMESIEGKRGIPRSKPPFPGQNGLFGKPTVINNVETFACVTWIVQQGHEEFLQYGTEHSKGSRLLSVSGDCKKPGLYDLSFGTSLRELLNLCEAENVQCVQVGGASGNLYFHDEIDGPFDFDNKGSGGAVMIFNRERNLQQIAKNFTKFFEHESCGFCTPCRVGTQVLPKLISNYTAHQPSAIRAEIEELSELLNTTSHCGLGKTAGRPALHYLRGLHRNEQ